MARARNISDGRKVMPDEEKKTYAVLGRVNKKLRLIVDKACRELNVTTAEFVVDAVMMKLESLKNK
jgi:hypothetical protein